MLLGRPYGEDLVDDGTELTAADIANGIMDKDVPGYVKDAGMPKFNLKKAKQLVIPFGHHTLESMSDTSPDEDAGAYENPPLPNCDLDPRTILPPAPRCADRPRAECLRGIR